MVHGRGGEDNADEFGVSGYVYKNIFLIFDRKTSSLWYPLENGEWKGISGPRKGETIPRVADPNVVRLGDWRKEHPNTVVLLGSKAAIAPNRAPEETAGQRSD